MIELQNVSKVFKVPQKHKSKKFLSAFFKRYDQKVALDQVSFTVNDGEIVGYIGPNGAGKSTTIKIMSGILTPTTGTCVINGFVPWKDRVKYVQQIGAVFGQRSNLAWDVPIIHSFELLKEIYKIPQQEYEKNLTNLTNKLQLQELLHIPLRQLSLGQKMRCEIAGALLHSPSILFLDEPTIGLDSVSKLAVRTFIKELNQEKNVTVILTTHDMNDIEALTNRIILIGKGKILYDGSFDEIKQRYGKTKTIEVEFANSYDHVELEGYNVIRQNGKTATFQNLHETFHLTKFIQDIDKKYQVSDINISNLHIEEVISQMYEEFEI